MHDRNPVRLRFENYTLSLRQLGAEGGIWTLKVSQRVLSLPRLPVSPQPQNHDGKFVVPVLVFTGPNDIGSQVLTEPSNLVRLPGLEPGPD